MSKFKMIFMFAGFCCVCTAAYLVLKMKMPLSYCEIPVSSEAVEYVIDLQKHSEITAEACALKYLYYKTDYQDEVPVRIETSIITGEDSETVVRIYDPACEDDSVFSTIDRIYLVKENSIWRPVRHDYAHRGRDRIGWTTAPTS